jgi:hypothetical protein
MRALSRAVKRVANLFRRQAGERDLQDELESNLQLQIDDNMRAGMPPDEARRKALVRLGSVDATKEAVRDARGIPFLETLAHDILFSVRLLWQNKTWTAVATLTLALGVGANTAFFTLVHNYA